MDLRTMDSHLDSVISLSKTCSSALSTVITTTLQVKTVPILMEGEYRHVIFLEAKRGGEPKKRPSVFPLVVRD